VGGGLMKIVNQTVPEALVRLGYSLQEIKEIRGYLEERETIEDVERAYLLGWKLNLKAIAI
jgi:Holliday junction resolvasome RuvABC DNA-binding subunit